MHWSWHVLWHAVQTMYMVVVTKCANFKVLEVLARKPWAQQDSGKDRHWLMTPDGNAHDSVTGKAVVLAWRWKGKTAWWRMPLEEAEIILQLWKDAENIWSVEEMEIQLRQRLFMCMTHGVVKFEFWMLSRGKDNQFCSFIWIDFVKIKFLACCQL